MNDAPVGHSSMRGAVAGDGGLRLRREVKGREDDEGREEEAGFHVVSEQEDEEAADGGRVPIDYRRPRRSSRPTRSALALARRRIRVAAAGGRRRRRRRIPKPLAEVRPSGVPPRRPRTAGGRLLPRRALGRVFLRGGGEGTQVDRLPLLGEAFTSVLSGGEASRRDDGVPPPRRRRTTTAADDTTPPTTKTDGRGGGGHPGQTNSRWIGGRGDRQFRLDGSVFVSFPFVFFLLLIVVVGRGRATHSKSRQQQRQRQRQMPQPATDEIATGDTPEHTREEAGLPDVSELLR